MTKKMRGHSEKKNLRKSRNSCLVNGRSCGCIGTVDSRPKCAYSWNQTKTLKDYLFCHIYCALLRSHVFAIVTASCTVSNRESWFPPARCVRHNKPTNILLAGKFELGFEYPKKKKRRKRGGMSVMAARESPHRSRAA